MQFVGPEHCSLDTITAFAETAGIADDPAFVGVLGRAEEYGYHQFDYWEAGSWFAVDNPDEPSVMLGFTSPPHERWSQHKITFDMVLGLHPDVASMECELEAYQFAADALSLATNEFSPLIHTPDFPAKLGRPVPAEPAEQSRFFGRGFIVDDRFYDDPYRVETDLPPVAQSLIMHPELVRAAVEMHELGLNEEQRMKHLKLLRTAQAAASAEEHGHGPDELFIVDAELALQLTTDIMRRSTSDVRTQLAANPHWGGHIGRVLLRASEGWYEASGGANLLELMAREKVFGHNEGSLGIKSRPRDLYSAASEVNTSRWVAERDRDRTEDRYAILKEFVASQAAGYADFPLRSLLDGRW